MTDLLFQDEVSTFINNISYEGPHTILFTGDSGSGRKTALNNIAEKLGAPVIDISEKLSIDLLDEISFCPICRIYFIDCDKVNSRDQSMILKTIEEPSDTSIFILIRRPATPLSMPIINRCVEITFKPYSEENLRHFCSNYEVLKYIKTPGDALSVANTDINYVVSLCRNIIYNLDKAIAANVLTIPMKIDFNSTHEGLINFSLFWNILLKTTAEEFVSTNNMVLHDLFHLEVEYSEYLNNNPNKRVFTSFLFEARDLIRGFNGN